MSTKTAQENHLMHAERLLNKWKHPQEQECLWFFSDEETSTRMKKSIQEMIGDHVWTDPTEVPIVMLRTKFSATVMAFGVGLRVNADADVGADAGADAYVETLRIIVVKPLWIDSA
ncbi:hypothetical protein ACTXT7_000233 [Hymenolepis weldensis]